MPAPLAVPHLRVARAPVPFAWDDAAGWALVPESTPLWLADGSAPAEQSTRVRVCFDDDALYVRFDCSDRDIWGTYTERDDPIYEQEAVEVFVAPGEQEPVRYFEFELSPNGVLFDATVYNPTSTRADLQCDSTWQCPGLRWMAQRNDVAQEWWGAFAIPWASITPDGNVPTVCRANFYRIERAHDRAAEFSCWCPTMTAPADFHKPAYFGYLEFETGSRP